MRKISIIGSAGTLGSACAMTISLTNAADELCLIDVNEALLNNHIMDLENAFPGKNIYRGEYEDLIGSSVVIITAGVPNRNDETSRDAYLADNLRIFQTIGEKAASYAPDAIIITASNPVDILNYYLYKKFGFSRNQLIGYNLNDSYRFEWAIRKVLPAEPFSSNFYTPVIGEHGETQVPLFSKVQKNGTPYTFTAKQKDEINKEINTWFVRFNSLNVPRTTGWTTGVGILRVVRAVLDEEETSFIGSSVLDGEYQQHDISIGVPITVNKKGILKVQEWELDSDEQSAFEKSAAKIRTTLLTHMAHS
ncbi:malate dehydrogenase [Alteribacillus persepolensis]|uniref:Malate dehydrogenase n=1 Tax=Alteribacillus persepolensis TaxID=568899 RepID=A0A1G8EFB0_9BACI|nr:hypothetical protein [Alteribacillus persepolensis]SDH68588.1 malate dehydrogenase [Alteribacillus persepolensis]